MAPRPSSVRIWYRPKRSVLRVFVGVISDFRVSWFQIFVRPRSPPPLPSRRLHDSRRGSGKHINYVLVQRGPAPAKTDSWSLDFLVTPAIRTYLSCTASQAGARGGLRRPSNIVYSQAESFQVTDVFVTGSLAITVNPDCITAEIAFRQRIGVLRRWKAQKSVEAAGVLGPRGRSCARVPGETGTKERPDLGG